MVDGTFLRNLAGMPALIAHRGASHDAPENTIAAFTRAWQEGADGIEGDFRLTEDGEIVCLHDVTTRRTCDRRLNVATSSLRELRTLDAGTWKGAQWKGERIPTLSEVLATVPEGKKIFMELKSGLDILVPLKKIVESSGLAATQMAIISFDARVVMTAKHMLPLVKAFLIVDFKHVRARKTWDSPVRDILSLLKLTGADGIDGKACAAVDHFLVEAIREARQELHLWTVNTLAEAVRFCNLGVDSLTTNRPGWLRSELCRWCMEGRRR